jgi:hypothetical protein
MPNTASSVPVKLELMATRWLESVRTSLSACATVTELAAAKQAIAQCFIIAAAPM